MNNNTSGIVIKACLPWYSTDRSDVIAIITIDTQAQIDGCLMCSCEKCTNCLAHGGKHLKKGRPQITKDEDVLSAISAKKTNKQICEELCISLSTLHSYKRRLSAHTA